MLKNEYFFNMVYLIKIILLLKFSFNYYLKDYCLQTLNSEHVKPTQHGLVDEHLPPCRMQSAPSFSPKNSFCEKTSSKYFTFSEQDTNIVKTSKSKIFSPMITNYKIQYYI